MKKHLSVLALYARDNLSRVLTLLLLMCSAETLLFWTRWQRSSTDLITSWGPELQERELFITFENLLKWVYPVSFLFLLLLTLLLCRGGEHRPAYTLRRLRVREETAALWEAVYNSICLLLFWAVQTAAALGLGVWYTTLIDPKGVTRQTIFLAFYRCAFLHNLLPLDNWPRYIAVAVQLAALGFSAAMMTLKSRRGSRYGWGMPVFLWGCLTAFFRQELDNGLAAAVGICVALAAVITDGSYLIRCWRGREQDD